MKFSKKLYFIISIILIGLSITSCSNDEITEPEPIEIISIEKSKEDGTIHYYTIISNDCSTYDFTIDGNGINGNDGQNWGNSHIRDNGNWRIGDTDTSINAQGQNSFDKCLMKNIKNGGSLL